MSFITNEAAALIRGAAANVARAFGASQAPGADGGNIVQELETFALDLVTGSKASLKYKLPTEKYTTTFNWEGKSWSFTADVQNGVLHLDAVPS